MKRSLFLFPIVIVILNILTCNRSPNSTELIKGKWLTYTGAKGIVVKNLESGQANTYAIIGEPVSLPPNSIGEYYPRQLVVSPRWSPDGERIAFIESYAIDESHLTIMKRDGTSIRILKTTIGNTAAPDWHPFEEIIVYSKTTYSVGGNYEIFTNNLKGDSPTRLTFRTGDDNSPDFSPDGEKIIFNSPGPDEKVQIFVMDYDGSNITQLTFNQSNHIGPRWSPFENTILFSQRDEDNDEEIYIMDLVKKNVIKLTDNQLHDSKASWSNDGKWIVFVRYSLGWHEPSIIIMRPDGTDEETLITDSGDDPDLYIY